MRVIRIVGLLGILVPIAAGAAPPLFAGVGSEVSLSERGQVDPPRKRMRVVRLDAELLRRTAAEGEGSRIELNLFEDARFVATTIEPLYGSGGEWFAVVEGKGEGGLAIFQLDRGSISGTLQLGDTIFEVSPVLGGHRILQRQVVRGRCGAIGISDPPPPAKPSVDETRWPYRVRTTGSTGDEGTPPADGPAVEGNGEAPDAAER